MRVSKPNQGQSPELRMETLRADLAELQVELSRANAALVAAANDDAAYSAASKALEDVKDLIEEKSTRLSALETRTAENYRSERLTRLGDAQQIQADRAQRARDLSVELNLITDRVNLAAAIAIAAAKFELAEAEQELAQAKRRVAALKTEPASASTAAAVTAEHELLDQDDHALKAEEIRRNNRDLRRERAKIDAEAAYWSSDTTTIARRSDEVLQDLKRRKSAVEAELAKV